MTQPTPISSMPSQSAAQQFTYESPAGITYVLRKLPAMRYLALSNAIVAYFGDSLFKIILTLKGAGVTDTEAPEENASMQNEAFSAIAKALEGYQGLTATPPDAFQKLARLVCPFIDVRGKMYVNPSEVNLALIDAQIDMMFSECPADVLLVVGRAIAFNLADFFSAARLPSILKRPTSS